MTPDAILDAAVQEIFNHFLGRALSDKLVRNALAAALPHLVAQRDARIKALEEVLGHYAARTNGAEARAALEQNT